MFIILDDWNLNLYDHADYDYIINTRFKMQTTKVFRSK